MTKLLPSGLGLILLAATLGASRGPYRHSAARASGGGPVVPCKIAIGGGSPVAEACARGGLDLAKKTMKVLVRNAKDNGHRFICEGCHKNLDDFELASDAREEFRRLLQAAGIGAASR